MSVEMITKGLDRIEEGLERLDRKQKEHADEILMLKQRGVHMGGNEAITGTAATLGAEVQRQFASNEESFRRHKTLALDVQVKSIAGSIVGARGSVGPMARDIAATLLPQHLKLTPAAGLAAMVYPRRATSELGAGASAVDENGARPQDEPIFTSITQSLVTIAGFAELSETALRTTGELQNVIDLHLQKALVEGLHSTLISGGTNFAGGLLGLATADVLAFAGQDALLEEYIARAAMTMRTNGYSPDIVVVNPNDWRSVYLRRDSTNAYINSSPLAEPPLQIAGMKVVFSTVVTTMTALLLDARYTDFMPMESARIELAYTGSQFTTGQITVRGELQGLPVVRDLNAIKLVSRAAS
jgi:hypothetical protein